jgi:lysophospholipase L1-like esterase
MSAYNYSFLALGDSYTIGEGVSLHESFPYQLVQMLRREELSFSAPEIIAKTGWTTFALKDHIAHTVLQKEYDFVTLLIGVNNQYQNLPIEDYKIEFDFLLNKSIKLAGNKAENVIVLSIPDWGVSPFAAQKNVEKIAEEIDQYNQINKQITIKYQANYIDITAHSREAKNDPLAFVEDGLHPTGKEYKGWAAEVFSEIMKKIQRA